MTANLDADALSTDRIVYAAAVTEASLRRDFGIAAPRLAVAGLNLFSYVVTISDDFTDPEIDAVFRQMQALLV